MRGVLLNSFPPCHFHGFLACCRSPPPFLCSSWIIKKCCDSLYDCESGAAALNCAVTFCLFFLCLFGVYPLFSHQVRTVHRPAALTPPKSHLGCPQGNFEMMNTKKESRVCPIYSILFMWIWIQVRVLFTGDRKGREGCFSFPSCTSNRTQIGTEGWAVSPGISTLSPAPTSLQDKPAGGIQHASVVFSNITKDLRGERLHPRPG